MMRGILQKRAHARGFTLTEIAIVLGIVGLILGTIWTAAAEVYAAKRSADLLRQIQITAENFRRFYATQVAVGVNSSQNAETNFSEMVTQTDSDLVCAMPCSTSTMLAAGILPADFVQSGLYATYNPNTFAISGFTSTYAAPAMYVTTEGAALWTGVYDCALYTEQENWQNGTNNTPPCQGKFVIELDLISMTQASCMFLLMDLVNARIDNLIGIATGTNGWGPVVGQFYGNPSMPTKMDVGTAASACASGQASQQISSDSGTSQIWVMFTN